MLATALLLFNAYPVSAVPQHVDKEEQGKTINQPSNPLAKPVQLAQPIEERLPEPQEQVAMVEEPQPVTTVAVAQTNCGSDPYQQLIYEHESGCRTNAINPGGCYGLGQDCNGIVQTRCGTDWNCQNDYFTSYMLGRYGTWQHAWAVWASQSWW